MSTSWDIPKRRLRLTLYDGDGKERVRNIITEDMAVQFNTSEALTGALNETNVVITGLKVDKIFDLATSTTPWIKGWVRNRMTIEAGYYNGRFSSIFDGSIISGKPSLENADYTISLKAMSLFSDLAKPKSYTFQGEIEVPAIASKIAADLGLKLVDATGGGFVVSNFVVNNQNAVTALRMLASYSGLDIYSTGGRLYLKKRGIPLPKVAVLTIGTESIIGVPEPTEMGVVVNVRLNPALITGQSVKIQSIKYPQLKSYNFYLAAMSHVGDTRGRDWYTRLNLNKEGLGWL